MQKFVDEMLKLPDVYFVTNYQAIQWMRHPKPSNQMNQFEPWQCSKKAFEPSEIACNLPNTCKLHSRVLQQDRYLTTCNECPPQYPWIRNEFGLDWSIRKCTIIKSVYKTVNMCRCNFIKWLSAICNLGSIIKS